MNDRYDAVVIGAGPAGLMAAESLLSAGYSVLMLEKHKKVGLPVSCAEAVSRVPFDRLITTRPEWVATEIDRVRLVGPSGADFHLYHPGGGYILNRDRFESDLARNLEERGVDIARLTIGLELIGNNGDFEKLKIMNSDGAISDIPAKIFIAADGVESKIARLAGIDNLIDFNEVESILQYRLEDIELANDTIEIHVGNETAPKGYAWVFPKSERSANVGLGVTTPGERFGECRKYLDQFVEKRFGRGKVVGKFCGMTPKYMGKKMFGLGNLLVVGDAARVLDSLSGAGIINAMISGREAGLAAAKYLSGGLGNHDEMQGEYSSKFLEAKGDELVLYRKLRNAFVNMSDGDFDDVVTALEKYFKKNRAEGINPAKLLLHIISTRPRLLRLVKYLI